MHGPGTGDPDPDALRRGHRGHWELSPGLRGLPRLAIRPEHAGPEARGSAGYGPLRQEQEAGAGDAGWRASPQADALGAARDGTAGTDRRRRGRAGWSL